jgi:hypothetical protein
MFAGSYFFSIFNPLNSTITSFLCHVFVVLINITQVGRSTDPSPSSVFQVFLITVFCSINFYIICWISIIQMTSCYLFHNLLFGLWIQEEFLSDILTTQEFLD